MSPTELIRADLGEQLWTVCKPRLSSDGELSPSEELSPFDSCKTYIIHGTTRQFDFRTLPGGSYCLYLADGRRALRLTRAGKEIEQILKEDWQALENCDPVVLSTLILKFFDRGIRESHRVLTNAETLISGEWFPAQITSGYVLDERELAKAKSSIGATSVAKSEDTVVLRAVTLRGWMHDKRNLGIERIHISNSGTVTLEKRQVLSKRVFEAVPRIRY